MSFSVWNREKQPVLPFTKVSISGLRDLGAAESGPAPHDRKRDFYKHAKTDMQNELHSVLHKKSIRVRCLKIEIDLFFGNEKVPLACRQRF